MKKRGESSYQTVFQNLDRSFKPPNLLKICRQLKSAPWKHDIIFLDQVLQQHFATCTSDLEERHVNSVDLIVRPVKTQQVVQDRLVYPS